LPGYPRVRGPFPVPEEGNESGGEKTTKGRSRHRKRLVVEKNMVEIRVWECEPRRARKFLRKANREQRTEEKRGELKTKKLSQWRVRA